ncbi:sugar transport protein 5-like [Canna indica]|uniref:Sugar transport protein 5-like n=1 Tax=Canna indica TaxID=4628 RepID=A0AAQ3L383_9LILI|nr:sugar transport protein 5-like [Canna indica]
MAGGGKSITDDRHQKYSRMLTASVIVSGFMAASGGLIYGYDTGVSGGLTAMESFLKPFFPSVLRKMEDAKKDVFCKYDSPVLTAFTSSLYISAMVASLSAGRFTNAFGRQAVMLLGGATFFLGSALNAAAVNVAMLIIGRLLLGVGVGFSNQAAPVYLAEMAPPQWRGVFTAGFQFFVDIGIVLASFTNYASSHIPVWGWRLSCAVAGGPAAIIFITALFISDTPSSLVQRGKLEDARAALRRARGASADIDAELNDITLAVEESTQMAEGAFRRILHRQYRPYLVTAIAIPVCRQLTGIIIIAFFAPVLFRTVGFGRSSALMNASILGAVNMVSVIFTTTVIDRYGRRFLFFLGGTLLCVCQVGVAWILWTKIGYNGEGKLPKDYAMAMLVLMCMTAGGFGCSWGPLSWVIPSEIFPLEIRSAGQSISVTIVFLSTFLQTQFLLAILCRLKEGTFILYAACVIVMTTYIALFLPETKGVPLESMPALFGRHWYWRRFIKVADERTELQLRREV